MIKRQKICTLCVNKLKFTFFIRLILVLIALNLSVPAYSFSQAAKVSLKMKNATLKDVFYEIESQTEYVFFYYEGLIDNSKINLEVSEESVDKVLNNIFKEKGITYSIEDRQIYLRKKEKEKSESLPTPVKSQEQVTVKGKVVDEIGDPLAGVNIVVVGSTRGVSTDVDGTFSIDVKPTDQLYFSFLGMEDQIVLIQNKRVLNIVMKEKTDELEEVTVVAFAKQKKESVVSSITSVKPSELKVPSSNLTTALSGRIAGVIAYQRSGEPGRDNTDFFIRGVTTFGYKKDPLILLDNFEISSSDLARLQPDDIESFNIMKDAAATALYGSRGANGVILVTTKRGSEGKPKLNFRVEHAISEPTKMPKLADPITYMRLHNEAIRTRNPLGISMYSQSKIENTMNPDRNQYVYPANDWYDIMFKPSATTQRINFNLNGGGKVARYYISATMNNDNGNLRVDKLSNFNNNINLKRYQMRTNVDISVTKTTEVKFRMQGSFDDYNGPIDTGDDVYKKVMNANPVLFPPYYAKDKNNEYTNHTLFGNYDKGTYINPYADMVRGYKEYSQSQIFAQFELEQKLDFITNGLAFRGLFNTSRYSYFDLSRSYTPFIYQIGNYDPKTDEYTLYGLNEGSGTEFLEYNPGRKSLNTTTYMEANLNWNRSFNDKHDVTAMVVFTMRNYLTGDATNLQTSLPARNMNTAGRLTYGFDSRYFVEANFGYNGSERFSKKERFGFFPSAGLGWIVSNEEFYSATMKEIIPKLKFKATYGKVGNDAIGSSEDRFFYLSNVNMRDPDHGASFGTYGDKGPSGGPISGVSITRYPNDKITWEIAKKLNIGVELSVFDKLEIQADYFTEKRSNILMERASIPASMGLQANVSANVGEASAHGVDISADYNHIINNDFWVTGRANFTFARSKLKFNEEPDYSDTPWKSRVGYSLGQRWGYVAERLFIDEEEIRNSPQQFGNYMAGDIKYKDINGDGKISELDQVPIGFPDTPEIIYGFGISLGYKGFDFSTFFQGSARSSFWIDPGKTSPFVSQQSALLKAYADDHWSENNRNVTALWPRLSEGSVENNTQQSTWFMQDGSFLRLKSLEFGYTLPRDLMKKIYVENLRLYFSGTNLLTFSNFKLWDVEMGGNGLGYPIQRVYNIGMQLTF